jgi:hypothetical protein
MKCTARPEISTDVSLPIKIAVFHNFHSPYTVRGILFSSCVYGEHNNTTASFCRLWLILLHVFSFVICDACCKYTPGLRICIEVVGPDQISLQIFKKLTLETSILCLLNSFHLFIHKYTYKLPHQLDMVIKYKLYNNQRRLSIFFFA